MTDPTNPKFYEMANYSKGAGEKVKEVLHEKKEGTLKTGSGKKVTSRKQAIAIGLSEARKEGAKVPAKKSAAKKSGAKKSSAKKGATKKSSAKKGATKKATAKKGGRAAAKKSSTKSTSKAASKKA